MYSKKIWESGAPYEGGTKLEEGRTIMVFYINGSKRVLFHGWVYDEDNLTEFDNIFNQIINTYQFLD